MPASVKNQCQLRTFLTAVRTRHGLTQEEFAVLVGLKGSMFSAFERGERALGYRSMRSIARKLALNSDIVAAMLDPKAPPVRLPSPKSITLRTATAREHAVPEIMIDLETAAKMIGAISAAGRALPLTELLQFAH